MAMLVGRLLVIDREPVCPGSFDGGNELRGLADRMRGDRVHSLTFDELEDFRGCEITAQDFAGRDRMHRCDHGEIDSVLTEARR